MENTYNTKIVSSLKREFEKNKKNYTKNETGSGTQSFVKQFFEKYLQLNEETNYNDSKNNFFLQEGKKSMGDNSRADFILKINGIKVVVEVERRNHINPGIKQVIDYMEKETTDYGILTDSEKWYFYTKGFNESKGTFGGGIEKDIDFLLTEEGFNFIENLFKTKEFYEKEILKEEKILVGDSEDIKDEDNRTSLKEFHKELISLAEKLKYDFSEQGIFNISNQNKDKNVIQAIYAFIIQFILIKIIQDKKGIKKIDKEKILDLLKKDEFTDLVDYTFESIDWLGEFYTPYQNEQKYLIESIKTKYTKGTFRNTKIDFEGSKIFLNLYNFIFKFNFKEIKQDIFGAVYENYLKELYKDDNSKKGQVFTPPEIVNFMLEEINYTPEYIKSKIEEYIEENSIDELKKQLLENKDKVDFNIDGLSIIDPACGSGTFLYKATGNILKAIKDIKGLSDYHKGILSENLIINNVVGFDIEAFPLYLAEMNILQILLFFNVNNKGEIINKINKGIKLFSTKDTISEFASMENDIKDILIELDNGNNDFSIFIKRNGKEISKIKLEIFDKNFKGIKKVVEKYLINQIRDKLKLYKRNIGKEYYNKILKIESITKMLKVSKEFTEKQTNTKNKLDLYKTIKNILKENGVNKIIEKLNKYKELLDTKRKKFDFVIGNPPYVSNNDILESIKILREENDIKQSNIFGENLNSLPKNIGWKKARQPRLNEYILFLILGKFLLLNGGKISYIIPSTLLSSRDMDTGRYSIIKKISDIKFFVFGEPLFRSRGILSNITINTSSLIIKGTKKTNKDYSDILFIKLDKKLEKKEFVNVNGDELIKNIDNWRIFTNKKFSHMYDFYKEKNIFMFFYYKKEYQEKYNKNFGLDIQNEILEMEQGFNLGSKLDIVKGLNKEYKKIFSKNLKKYICHFDNKTISYDIDNIRNYNKNIKGLDVKENLLLDKYKIIFPYKNFIKSIGDLNGIFRFCDEKVAWHTSNYNGIGGNNKKEILYLFNILNSFLTRKILYSSYYLENEQSFNISFNMLKLGLRVPKIDSKIKKELKEKLIKNGEEIINYVKDKSIEKKYKDIFETEVNLISLGEKITGIKEKYKNLEEKIKEIEGVKELFELNNKLEDNLPEEILKLLPDELEKFEEERDLIVYCLYFGSENGNNEYIDLSEIDVNNILKDKERILNNKWVKVILQ